MLSANTLTVPSQNEILRPPMNSYTASEARAATGIDRDSLKTFVDNGLITTIITKSAHKKHSHLYSFTNLVEMAFANKLREYGITRPKLLRRWLPKVSKGLKIRANILVCQPDGSVTYYAEKKTLAGLTSGVVIHFSSIWLDLLIRTGESLEESPLTETGAAPKKSVTLSKYPKTASA